MHSTSAFSRVARSIAVACLWSAVTVQADTAKPADTVRPVVGTPLLSAQTAITGGRFAEALSNVSEAEKAATDASAYELYIINRTKAAAAMGAGQTELAFTATEAAIATKAAPAPEQLALIESLVHAAYGAKDYARAARWADRYAQEGGAKPDVASLRVQAQYLGGDYAGAAATLNDQVKADDAAGRSTPERELRVLASAQAKLGDTAGRTATIERLATHHPKPAYWSELLSRIDRRTLDDRLALDFLRLAHATGSLGEAGPQLALAEIALSAGFAGESLAVLDAGLAKGVLGVGPDAAKHRALRDRARKLAADDAAARQRDEAAARASRDGNALVMLGQIAAAEGRFDDGMALMEQGLAKGGVRREQEARLRLGEAQALSGRSAEARQTLGSVQGAGGLSELTQLWRLYASVRRTQPAVTAPASQAGAGQRSP